jgi:hypothetical protein
MLKVFTAVVALLVPSAAQAGSVYLNGVNIDAVRDKVFEDCSVRIDAAGNIHITAKGYVVKKPNKTKPEPAPAATVAAGGVPQNRYWLVTEKASPGMSQYDIDLFINRKWVRKFLAQEEHVVMEITKHLRAGKNKVHLVAKKSIGSARRSSSPNHTFRIIIGEGNSGGRNVMISKKLVDYKRTAMETEDFRDEFVIEVN